MIIIIPLKKKLNLNGYSEITFKVICSNSFGFTHEVTEAFAGVVGCRYLKKSNVAKVQTYVSFVSYIKGKLEAQGHPTDGVVFCENDVKIH